MYCTATKWNHRQGTIPQTTCRLYIISFQKSWSRGERGLFYSTETDGSKLKMIQEIFIPHSQREEQGPAQKIKRLYWRFSWKNSSTGSLVLVLRQRTVGELKGVTETVADQVASASPYPALWIPSCVNLHSQTPTHVYMDGWAWPKYSQGLAACFQASDWLQTSQILQSIPPVPSPCACCLSTLCFSLSSPAENVTELEGLVTPKETIFFQLSYGEDCVVWLLWRLSGASSISEN